MNTSLVSNTGPILALAGVGQIELLKYLCKRVFVPRSVHLEIEQGGKEGLGLSQYLRADWIEVQSEGKIDPLLLSQLDIGEAAVV